MPFLSQEEKQKQNVIIARVEPHNYDGFDDKEEMLYEHDRKDFRKNQYKAVVEVLCVCYRNRRTLQ